MRKVYLHDFAVASRLGLTREATLTALGSSKPPKPDIPFTLVDGRQTLVAGLPDFDTGDHRSRTEAILAYLVEELDRSSTLDAFLKGDRKRLAVIIGTSTTGIQEGQQALGERLDTGTWNDDYDFSIQELGDPAIRTARRLGAKGPVYTVSTACTSSTRALISAARLIAHGRVDTAISGGADAIADLTVNGFDALDLVAETACLPFSANRSGINIGEGGGLFLLSAEPAEFELAGWGATTDAYHMSSPLPSGEQAERALREALDGAGCEPHDVDFVHLHGTATPMNDATEAALMKRLFGAATPLASTKGMTGHTLGAAGALQLAFNLIAMREGIYPPHVFDGHYDESLPALALTTPSMRAASPINVTMCANYAFGGSNAALLVRRVTS